MASRREYLALDAPIIVLGAITRLGLDSSLISCFSDEADRCETTMPDSSTDNRIVQTCGTGAVGNFFKRRDDHRAFQPLKLIRRPFLTSV